MCSACSCNDFFNSAETCRNSSESSGREIKEMAKPRVAMSAREPNDALPDKVLVVENNVKK